MPIPQFLPGETVSASTLQQLATEATYTPVLTATTTNPDIGTGPTLVGLIWVSGQRVDVWFEIVFGESPSVGSGNYEISLPALYPFASNNVNFAIGQGRILDQSASDETTTIIVANTVDNRVQLRSTENSAPVTHAAPYTLAESDIINGHFSYLTDFGGA